MVRQDDSLDSMLIGEEGIFHALDPLKDQWQPSDLTDPCNVLPGQLGVE